MIYILSIVIGLILGMLLVLYNNIEYHGPDSNIVRHKRYKDTDGCVYKFVPQPYLCRN